MTVEWDCEYTDTFGREANYSWVRRKTIVCESGLDRVQLVRRIKAALSISGMRGVSMWHGDMWEFRPHNSCTVAFANVVY